MVLQTLEYVEQLAFRYKHRLRYNRKRASKRAETSALFVVPNRAEYYVNLIGSRLVAVPAMWYPSQGRRTTMNQTRAVSRKPGGSAATLGFCRTAGVFFGRSTLTDYFLDCTSKREAKPETILNQCPNHTANLSGIILGCMNE